MPICLSCARKKLKEGNAELCALCSMDAKLTARDRLGIAVRKAATKPYGVGFIEFPVTRTIIKILTTENADTARGSTAPMRWTGHPSAFKPRSL